MNIRRNQVLRLGAVVVNGHMLRTVRCLNGGAIKAEVVRAHVRGGKTTRRWVPIEALGIKLYQITMALETQKEVPATF